MCRISGILYKQDPDWKPLISMQQHQVSGGPDSSGMWTNDNCGLAHNRLSILDLSDAGSQPMESENWVLCYNGEIYNHLELRKKIQRDWRGTSDTETLLYHIEVYGLDATLNAIEGMYAFAAYHKASKTLYLVTDPLSIKPLYYSIEPHRLLFASTIGAIALQLDHLGIDKQSLIDYLALGSTFHPLFAGIHKVQPGTIIHFGLRGETLIISATEYWKPKASSPVTEDELIGIVEHSIKSIQISDVPLFLFLSGGIDSSVVAGCLPGVGAVHLSSPEESYAREVADHFGSSLSVIDPAQENAEACLKDYSFKSGDCSMAALIPYITSKHSVKFGKVAISANGADELFFGYDRTERRVTDHQVAHIFRKSLFDKSSWSALVPEDPRELELTTYVTYDLNKTLDFASMCHGLEVRVPYLNRSVIEAALSMSRDQHVNGYGFKSILKKWLIAKGFSKGFVNRPKLGFSLHREPKDWPAIQAKGIQLLKNEFGISPKLVTGRDAKYYAAAAGAFYCWFETWKKKL